MGIVSGINGSSVKQVQFKKIIRESVDSLCRDGADVQYMQYFKQKPYTFTTNTLKAYLSAQMSSLSAFVISISSQFV